MMCGVKGLSGAERHSRQPDKGKQDRCLQTRESDVIAEPLVARPFRRFAEPLSPPFAFFSSASTAFLWAKSIALRSPSTHPSPFQKCVGPLQPPSMMIHLGNCCRPVLRISGFTLLVIMASPRRANDLPRYPPFSLCYESPNRSTVWRQNSLHVPPCSPYSLWPRPHGSFICTSASIKRIS
jgi:hypothetical protein